MGRKYTTPISIERDERKQYPECVKNCETVRILGVGECESVCPEKFDDEPPEDSDPAWHGPDIQKPYKDFYRR